MGAHADVSEHLSLPVCMVHVTFVFSIIPVYERERL